jgi:hypothetical protein
MIASIVARAPVGSAIAAPAGWKPIRRDTCIVAKQKPLTQALYLRVATSTEPAAARWRVRSATAIAVGLAAYRGVDPARPVQSTGGRLTRNSRIAFAPSVVHGESALVAMFFGRTGRAKILAPRGATQRFISSTAPTSTLAVEVPREQAGRSGRWAAGSTKLVACNIGQAIALRSSSRTTAADPPVDPPPPVPGPPPGAPPSSGDVTPPSAPANLRATRSTTTSVNLAWGASTDNVRVAGYGLYQNNAFRGTATGTAVSFPGLTCGTTYTFAVDAYDASGNRSGRSPITASTSACAGGGTPPPPPPPPPPTPGGGTTLTFTDTFWRCTQPISQYAVHGLPLRVVMLYTRPVVPPNAGAVQFGDGCVGDGTPATDVVLDIRGDGRTYGPGDDAIRIMAGSNARDLEIEGQVNCGPRVGGAHQDGVQVLGGINITFRNLQIGDYDGGRATCQGAGGAFFYSLSSTNVDVEGGKFIACNHALLAGTASAGAEVRNASFRTGGDPVCVQEESFSASEPCDVRTAWRSGGGTTSGLTCQRWNGSAWVDH